MPMQSHKYPVNWKEISQNVRKEAGQKCEWCDVANGAVICRNKDGSIEVLTWIVETNNELVPTKSLTWSRLKFHGLTRVVLTVAHLDRNQANNARENLAALCQRCHLQHDIRQHIANRRYGRNHADQQQLKLQL